LFNKEKHRQMNITLPIKVNENHDPEFITFYKIYALSPAYNNQCFIHTNGTQYLCTLSFEEVWNKLKHYEKSI